MLIGKRILATVVLIIAAAPHQSRAADQWQYGELHYEPRIRNADNKPTVQWGTLNAVVEGGDWEGMAEKLKALENLPKDNPQSTIVLPKDNPRSKMVIARRLEVLNALGRDGWEMVSYTLRADSDSETWIFKRRVP